MILVGGLALSCPTPATPVTPQSSPYRVLQINMCNSGEASCYTGRARTGTIALITQRRPSVVMLNEVCRGDLRSIRNETGYVGIFAQSGSKLCRNASPFGNAVMFRPGTRPGRAQVTEYTRQDPDVERRTLTCVAAGGVTACVTHLSAEGAQFSQAREMASIVRRHAARGTTVLGGDWNIPFPAAQRYVPVGMFRKGDGNVQHIMATDDFGFVRTRRTSLAWTDHPAFEVHLLRRRPSPASRQVNRLGICGRSNGRM